MFTPQQIEEVSFRKATFGGYDMQAVDDFLEPLIQDYMTLYKENALLKSKMRVLVAKLEEYRDNEENLKESARNAQKTCDAMLKETQLKCAKMLQEANQAAAENAKNASAIVAEEQSRVEEARRLAASKISDLQLQLNNCIEQLEAVKSANRPAAPRHTRGRLFDTNAAEAKTGALADEIAHNLAIMIGETDDSDMKLVP